MRDDALGDGDLRRPARPSAPPRPAPASCARPHRPCASAPTSRRASCCRRSPCRARMRGCCRGAGLYGEKVKRICDQSASSSSAASVARPVVMPCPISKCLLMTVTVSSAAMRRNTLGSKISGPTLPAAACALGANGTCTPSTRAAALAPAACRNPRRATEGGSAFGARGMGDRGFTRALLPPGGWPCGCGCRRHSGRCCRPWRRRCRRRWAACCSRAA